LSCFSVFSAVSDIRLSAVLFDNGMSFTLLAADWSNTEWRTKNRPAVS